MKNFLYLLIFVLSACQTAEVIPPNRIRPKSQSPDAPVVVLFMENHYYYNSLQSKSFVLSLQELTGLKAERLLEILKPAYSKQDAINIVLKEMKTN